MAKIAAYGLATEPPKGWDSEIYQRPPEEPGPAARPQGLASETPMPILHLANFPLPAQRGDYGGGAVEQMGSGGVFISILEHGADEAKSPLFIGRKAPWPLRADDFNPDAMQRRIANQAGCQAFFLHNGRPFCLYVVIGSYRMRDSLINVVNDALATVVIE